MVAVRKICPSSHTQSVCETAQIKVVIRIQRGGKQGNRLEENEEGCLESKEEESRETESRKSKQDGGSRKREERKRTDRMAVKRLMHSALQWVRKWASKVEGK